MSHLWTVCSYYIIITEYIYYIYIVYITELHYTGQSSSATNIFLLSRQQQYEPTWKEKWIIKKWIVKSN